MIPEQRKPIEDLPNWHLRYRAKPSREFPDGQVMECDTDTPELVFELAQLFEYKVISVIHN